MGVPGKAVYVCYCRRCDRGLTRIDDVFACAICGVEAEAELVLRAVRDMSLTLASGVSVPVGGWGIKRVGRGRGPFL